MKTDDENARSWRLTKVAVFALIAVAAIVWLIVDQRRAAALQEIPKTGTAVQGRVAGMDLRRGGQLLLVSYRFVVGDATLEIRDRRVGDFTGLVGGGPVTVWYDPKDPQRCVIANELTHVRFGWTPYLFGGVIVVMMGLAAFQAWQVVQPRREEEP